MKRLLLRSKALITPTADGVKLHNPVTTLTIPGQVMGRLAAEIVPLLGGTASRAQILDSIAPPMRDPASTFLDLTERLGLVDCVDDEEVPGQPAVLLRQRRMLTLLGMPAEAALERLAAARVLVAGATAWGYAAIRELAAAGVTRIHLVAGDDEVCQARFDTLRSWVDATAPWCSLSAAALSGLGREEATAEQGWTLLLNVLPFFDVGAQLDVAALARRRAIPSLPASVKGFEVLIGPFEDGSGDGACWYCAHRRALANQDPLGGSVPCAPAPEAADAEEFSLWASPSPAVTLAGALTAMEVLRGVLAIPAGQEAGELQAFSVLNGTRTTHRVIPLPFCPACGGAAGRGSAKAPTPLNGCRSVEDIRRALAGWIDNRVGIIASLDVREPEEGVPQPPFLARALLAHQTDGSRWLGFSEACGGKGSTEVEAAFSAVGEAFERYSAAVVVPGALHRARMADLAGDVIDPRELCLYTEDQYAAKGFPFVRFDPDGVHAWKCGVWLHDRRAVWAPAVPTYYSDLSNIDDAYWQVTSNGLAAGRDFEDAARRAVLELLERDAVMTSWMCRRPARRVVIDETADEDSRDTIDLLTRLGAEVEVYLLDVGTPVATAACFAYGDGVRWPGLTVGSAADLSPRAAIRKAVMEQAFSGLACRRIMLDRSRRIPELAEVKVFLDHALYHIPPERNRSTAFLRASPSCRLCTLPEPVGSDTLDGLATVLDGCGIRIALIDLTAPDVQRSPFRVVRALGPHLQPLFCGFGLERVPGRRVSRLLNGPPNQDLHPLC